MVSSKIEVRKITYPQTYQWPDGYEELQYLESYGSQWIDVGLTPTSSTIVECKAVKQQGFSLYGSGTGNYVMTGDTPGSYAKYNNSNTSPFYTGDHTIAHVWKTNYPNVYVDGILVGSVAATNITCTDTLTVFGRHVGNTVNDLGSHKVYWLKYSEGTQLKAYLVPAKRISDDQIGFYDLIRRQFLTNSGTGNFGTSEEPVGYDIVSPQLYRVEYTHTVNSGTQLSVGTVASAQLIFDTKEQLQVGQTLVYYNSFDETDYLHANYKKIGLFIVDDVQVKPDGQTKIYTYTCYDFIKYFEKVCDYWYNNILYASSRPIKLIRMADFPNRNINEIAVLESLVEWMNATYDLQLVCQLQENCNRSWYVNDQKFSGKNITGKYILGLIAQIAGGYACADENGKIWVRTFGKDNYSYDPDNQITTYTPPSINLDKTTYTNLVMANFDSPAIDRVMIQYNTSGATYEITKTGTTGENLLRIANNPWCFDVPKDGTYGADQFYWNSWCGSFLRFKTYRPCTVNTLIDYNINAGDLFHVTDYEGNTHLTCCMTKTISSSGVKLSCEGVKIRDEAAALEEQQIDLTGYLKQADYDAGLRSNNPNAGMHAEFYDLKVGESIRQKQHIDIDRTGLRAGVNDYEQEVWMGTQELTSGYPVSVGASIWDHGGSHATILHPDGITSHSPFYHGVQLTSFDETCIIYTRPTKRRIKGTTIDADVLIEWKYVNSGSTVRKGLTISGAVETLQ